MGNNRERLQQGARHPQHLGSTSDGRDRLAVADVLCLYYRWFASYIQTVDTGFSIRTVEEPRNPAIRGLTELARPDLVARFNRAVGLKDAPQVCWDGMWRFCETPHSRSSSSGLRHSGMRSTGSIGSRIAARLQPMMARKSRARTRVAVGLNEGKGEGHSGRSPCQASRLSYSWASFQRLKETSRCRVVEVDVDGLVEGMEDWEIRGLYSTDLHTPFRR
ncbi:hypothetical protein B0T26DRAFT_158756 [Lasiosphaeria miniovina]|uniref:Uncharacterized protein n=1 Tax=Lasiosphaeria miniovina TaxID=1954250 RepID=A0AA40B5L4_9PEZI|nr:uncharacterized protein B0T26DRAFT_158756 [Lasiosphaeria miniovina]KAK0728115.1 hypothetical protein B0T26DRAFT_158756 [Lasiosphaeria miniovina]